MQKKKKKKKKAPAPAAPTKRLNKTAWIQKQPRDVPAKTVVARAGAAGIKLTVAQVYTARSAARKKNGRDKPEKPTSGPSVTSESALALLEAAEAYGGLENAQALLAFTKSLRESGLFRS